MHKYERRNEGILYEPPNTRNEINEEVKEELAGRENNRSDAFHSFY